MFLYAIAFKLKAWNGNLQSKTMNARVRSIQLKQ